jgi:hypothetical protein
VIPREGVESFLGSFRRASRSSVIPREGVKRVKRPPTPKPH